MSGGVDSSVSAALLKQAGHTVIGVFIKIWQPEFIECTWREDRLDAMRVAAHLQIPFREIDLSTEYKHDVIDSMVTSYKQGITPNPDVLCNEHVKFGVFYRWARAQRADIVATGHYARIQEIGEKHILLRGVDTNKDQSYFVHRMQATDIPHIQFPVGGLEKSKVRTLAKKFALPVATKPDSQGLCFVGDVSMRDFLRRYITVEEGNVVDKKGHVIGTHEGAILYTVGQRHGLTIHTGSTTAPHYVIETDTAHNIVTVSENKEDAARIRIVFSDVLWINDAPMTSQVYDIQTRYRETPLKAHIVREDDHYVATCDIPHIVAPGQSLVVYNGNVCLGGGIIS